MDKFYPPYFPCYIPLPNGKPAAGGKLYAYFTGTDNLAPLYAEDGTILVGSVADIDSSGQVHVLLDPAITYRLKVVPPVGSQMPDQIYDNVRVANGTIVGMENPMTDQGDMIVGAAAGVPMRLAHPNGIGFLRATLQFGMKVLQWVGLTGTKGIEVTNGGAGTEIGLDTTGASEGDALKIVSGVPTWTTDQTGMANPMTTAGDLIVGSAGGEPARLGVGTDGDILATASGAPTWEAGPKKYRNVYSNIPSPQIDDGYLGCLFYLSGSAQSLTLPATASIPDKSFIDFVFLDGTARLTITPQGTTTLNEQGSAVKIGGQASSLYRLTFLGHGGSGDEWAVGGSVLPDWKVKVSATDTRADYLWAKVHGGTLVNTTVEYDGSGYENIRIDLAALGAAPGDVPIADGVGGAVFGPIPTQPGDHQLLVSATDAAEGYLGAKLTAGSNITLTPQTDGDGVQTLEISATGGGGGGGDPAFYPVGEAPTPVWMNFNSLDVYGVAFVFRVPTGQKIKRLQLGIPSSSAAPAFFDAATYKRTNTTTFSINWHPTWTYNKDGNIFEAVADSTHTAEYEQTVNGEELVILVGHGVGKTNVDFWAGLAISRGTGMSIPGANYGLNFDAFFKYAMCYYVNRINGLQSSITTTNLVIPTTDYIMPWTAIFPS